MKRLQPSGPEMEQPNRKDVIRYKLDSRQLIYLLAMVQIYNNLCLKSKIVILT